MNKDKGKSTEDKQDLPKEATTTNNNTQLEVKGENRKKEDIIHELNKARKKGLIPMGEDKND